MSILELWESRSVGTSQGIECQSISSVSHYRYLQGQHSIREQATSNVQNNPGSKSSQSCESEKPDHPLGIMLSPVTVLLPVSRASMLSYSRSIPNTRLALHCRTKRRMPEC